MSPSSHSAAPNAIGYLHQTRWGLVELLRAEERQPDASITLELHDDVAWEESGSPTQLLQLKHHQNSESVFTDSSTDLWRTIKSWLDTTIPGDPNGPQLLLVTTQTAGSGTAVEKLRPQSPDPETAAERLYTLAKNSQSRTTAPGRQAFLKLSASDRQVFTGRIRVLDGSASIENVDEIVQRKLFHTAPVDREEVFLAMVWKWWDTQSLALLQRRRHSVSVNSAHLAISEIRDQFTNGSLPTLIETNELDQSNIVDNHMKYMFVQQLQWVKTPPTNLQKAVIDYYRAYTQTSRWLDEDLIGYQELESFEINLVDEWDREFEWMLDELGQTSDNDAKVIAGKKLLRKLLSDTSVTVRKRYDEPFFARGKRHELANTGQIGWHPEFRNRVQSILGIRELPTLSAEDPQS